MASGDKKKSRTGGIHTLSDLNRRSADWDSDSDDPPEYYTGGEKSGMLVQDATKDNIVDSIFDQARELGATGGPFDPSSASSSSRSFAGTGRLLSGETVQPTPAQPETVVHNINFWSNGFTINDGPLRRLDDPENASFLESIKKSECPKELEPADRSTSVHVNLIRRNEKCPDPTKDNDVDSIFDQARELGATEGPFDPSSASSSSRSFAGTGRLLSGETVQPTPAQPKTVVHNIIFWSNGFTINDGPLRRLDNPENASFLESIKKSECPKELEPADRSTSVHVNLMRRNEKCPEPGKRHVPYQGVGRTLGGSSTPAASEPTASTSFNTAPTPSADLVVDEKLPSTSVQVQLRLADGSRRVGHFNYHHTINDVRGFIDTIRPDGPRNYHLQIMGFPPKLLNDPSQTIEQAGLANSVVIQKL